MARVARGLIIGKFLPPHRGHQYLIDYARARAEHLTLILFAKPSEPIPGQLRAAWLREMAGDAEVLIVHDEHPIDFADPATWDLWIGSIRHVYPQGPDVVFSSEAYGAELARRLGSRHECVDPDRTHVPISASRIRANPQDVWEYLPPGPRAYYCKRVCLLGTESTGKTTLAAALAEHLRTVWVPEYAREYLEAAHRPCEERDMLSIARGQVALEEERARQANRLVICDTNLLTTMLWYEHYWGRVPEEIRTLHARRKYDLYLLTSLDVPWVGDGLRDAPHRRDWFHARYSTELRERSLPHRVLSGSHGERMAQACSAIESLLTGSTGDP